MKTRNSVLAIALGLAAHGAPAQSHPPPQPLPDSPAQSASPSEAMPSLPSPPADASGASSGTAPDASGAGAPTESGSGSDTPGSMPDSSGASGVQSEAGAELRAAAPAPARLQPQTQDDVTYLCGGVGIEEASYMKQQARGYDLMLTFAARDGSYLADVNVDIRDAKGNPVLQTNCDSPILLVDLPRSGTYRIHADAAGYALNKTARVQAKQKASSHVASVVLTWPQQVAEAPSRRETSSGSSGTPGDERNGPR